MSIFDAPPVALRTVRDQIGRYKLSTYLKARANTKPGIATLGNSIFAGVNGISFIDQALWKSGNLMTWLKNGGIAGNTSAMMLARVGTDVPDTANMCVFMEGSNDGLGNVPVLNHRQNMEGIIQNLLSRGIVPIMLVSAPLTTKASLVASYIAAEIALANKYGISIYDPWGADVDPLTGDWASGISGDNVHPSFAGAIVATDNTVSAFANDTIQGFVPRSNAAGTAGYLLSGGNQLFLGAVTSGVPAGWSLAGSATGSVQAAPAGFKGNSARITSATATGNPYLTKSITTGWQPGDEILLSFGLAMNAAANPQQTFLTVRVDGVELNIVNGAVANIPMQRHQFTVKPTTSSPIQIYLKVNGAGTGSYVEICEFEVYNLTALLNR
jgi:acyl-CoA thioesterase I